MAQTDDCFSSAGLGKRVEVRSPVKAGLAQPGHLGE